MLTYDQTSEIRCAFEEAYIEPGRRRAIRVKQRVDVQIFPWRKGQVGAPINVTVEDFSSNGVGVLHNVPLELGTHYMLKVPRHGKDELHVVFTVVRRCQADVGSYSIGLEAAGIANEDGADLPLEVDKYMNTVVSRRTKILFLLFGILSLTVAVQLTVL